jgi:hypothetical protein
MHLRDATVHAHLQACASRDIYIRHLLYRLFYPTRISSIFFNRGRGPYTHLRVMLYLYAHLRDADTGTRITALYVLYALYAIQHFTFGYTVWRMPFTRITARLAFTAFYCYTHFWRAILTAISSYTFDVEHAHLYVYLLYLPYTHLRARIHIFHI